MREEAAVVAQQREEEMRYVAAGGAVLGLAGMTFGLLNWMSRVGERSRRMAIRNDE